MEKSREFYFEAKIDGKGRVQIPISIRIVRGMNPGDWVSITGHFMKSGDETNEK